MRGASIAALAAAAVVPLVRKRFNVHPAVTTAAVVAGPPALAVLVKRTPARDLALYALQGWAFVVAHELPYDDPAQARRRLKVDYPIRFDTWLGRGRLPTVRLQSALAGLGRDNLVDRTLSWFHWVWFIWPHLSLVWILAREPQAFARAARQMSAVYDIGCVGYAAIPTAPPWWASENGHTPDKVRRIMIEVGEATWGPAWPTLYGSFGSNPWAAMPSLHFGSSVMAAILLSEMGPIDGAVGWAYALTLGFALVYMGEHYVADLLAGAAVVGGVRVADPLAEPLADALSHRLQKLERIANE